MGCRASRKSRRQLCEIGAKVSSSFGEQKDKIWSTKSSASDGNGSLWKESSLFNLIDTLAYVPRLYKSFEREIRVSRNLRPFPD
mmetsp:Transcript_3832/g.6700  ORF Transcript_3832/g.6700 Transcript_3832/m.6700 type:complete len:84 (+) Transcript_3832:1332-1583(+)